MSNDIVMTPVESSNIKAVGVDGDKLRVEFNNGALWEYDNAAQHHDEIINAKSKGKSPGSYFHHNVRTLDGRKLES